jgi:hypothetical protein
MSIKTPRGIAGNAKTEYGIVDRQWAAPSYDPNTGRAASSLSPDQGGPSPVGAKVGRGNRQMPAHGFDGRDARSTTIPTPVRNRPFTQSR